MNYSKKISWAAIAVDRKGQRPYLTPNALKMHLGVWGCCKPPLPMGPGQRPGGGSGGVAPESSGFLCINSTQFALKTISKSTFNYNKRRLAHLRPTFQLVHHLRAVSGISFNNCKMNFFEFFSFVGFNRKGYCAYAKI